MDWGLAGSVILSGMVIVFIVLILLIWLVSLTGRLSGGRGSGKEAPESAPKPAAAKLVPAPAPAPVVQAGIEEETVAVISAAVYACMDSSAPGTQYVIRDIKRAAGERPVWGFAGMQQNTRPF